MRASSRLTRPPTPMVSGAVHGLVALLWVVLLMLASGPVDHHPVDHHGYYGLFAWSVGLAYLGYDTALSFFTGWQIRRIGGPEPPPLPDDSLDTRLTLAVIVAAHDELDGLPATVAALLEQADVPDEIIIADDGSSDGTAEMLCANYGFALPEVDSQCVSVRAGQTVLSWLRLTRRGKSGALNAALLTASADVVVTVDADTLPAEHAIGAVRQAFSREPQLVACTGIVTPQCTPTPVGRVMQWFQTYEYIRNFLARYAWMRVDCLQLLSGAFAGFRRTSVVEVGGFDDVCLVEDYELVARLRRYAGENRLDWRFRVLGAAQASTEAPGSVPAFLAQRRRWFGGFLQTHWWYRAMVGDRRLGRLGTIMLPLKAIDAMAPLYGLTAVGLLVYFLATSRFGVLVPVLIVLAGKLCIDVVFHLWALRQYRRWVGDPRRASSPAAALVLLVEPLTFTVLLHIGALLGWVAFLGGAQRWGSRQRFGLSATRAVGSTGLPTGRARRRSRH